MRVAFSIPIQEYRNDGKIEDFEYDIFRSVLMLNERLMYFSHTDQLDLATLLFSCNYVQNDDTVPKSVSGGGGIKKSTDFPDL